MAQWFRENVSNKSLQTAGAPRRRRALEAV